MISCTITVQKSRGGWVLKAAEGQKTLYFFSLKKTASPTGNTLEALQCVRWYQKAPEGACRPFKVLTLTRPKLFELIVLYVGTYIGT